MVSLPIPNKKVKKIEVIYIPSDPSISKKKLEIHYKKEENLSMPKLKEMVYSKLNSEINSNSIFTTSSSYKNEAVIIEEDKFSLNEVKKKLSSVMTTE